MEQQSLDSSSIPQELQERYTHWKKNTRLLYDYLNTNTAKWPSLTCEFFPDLDTANDTHRILLSSFTSGQLPQDECITIAKISTSGHLQWSSLNNFDMEEMEFKPDNTSTKFPPKNLITEINITFPQGDCNRARSLPQNPDVIGAASSDGSIYIFDRTKHGSRRAPSLASDTTGGYELRLAENADVEAVDSVNEAVSLEWNMQKEATLASCYSQGAVKIWDVTQYSRSNPHITKPVHNLQFDSTGCNDVTWMSQHHSLLSACGENNVVGLLDLRADGLITAKTNIEHHNNGVNACKFNKQNNMLLASADSSGRINLWDIRKFEQSPIRTLHHGSSIATIEWNPNVDVMLASAGQDDGLVKIWDTANAAPVFVHGGHMLGVNDIAWDHHDPWLMCSVSKDNSIHVWRPAAHLVAETSPLHATKTTETVS